ncbi:TetR/AcrR family transcriptional regulator [Microbacterium marinilacus]|uniref:TetR family transcriptional regulator n=1 Tax=Microbacterium marinilacus TaxID=415209 RepID=A0ABP7BMU5_9MICO|nr:TetR family transcriptional regulator [Microbacterium marinilacus]MBY0688864.1 TetR family transcriptional regulator [Microbacterium marinilacus]
MPELPSTARGTATRRRILDVAADEFAERGIAGARIERITRAARTNKAQVYGYFGSKDGLFDAVVSDSIDRLTTIAPFEGADLAGWAVRLYDEYLRQPELIRLTTWIRLERRPTGRLFDDADHAAKLTAIEEAQAAGRIRAGDPFELLTLVIGMSCAWSPASGVYAAGLDETAAVHTRRRELLRESVTRVLAP